MASFGENLRREREMRGVTLEEIAAATKVSGRFLKAIEDEKFSVLPGGIFTRSFVRQYANYLGLDEERIMAEYQALTSGKVDVDLTRIVVSRPLPPKPSKRTPLITLLVAGVMLVGGYLLYRYSRPAVELLTPSTGPTEVVPAPAPTSTIAPTTGVTSAPPDGPPPAPAVTTATAPAPAQLTSPEEGLVLQVAATERSWVAIDADGKTTLQRILNPNEVETIRARESFDVITGNAQGVVLTLNGETLRPLGRRGEVKSVRLTRNDLKNTGP